MEYHTVCHTPTMRHNASAARMGFAAYAAFVLTHEFVHHVTQLSDENSAVEKRTDRAYQDATAACGC